MPPLQLGDITVDVIRKDIKNIHLSVYPPTGKVRLSAPQRFDLDTIRVFALSKLPWIKQQQAKLRDQKREAPREYVDRESHFYQGQRYLLRVVEREVKPGVRLHHKTMELSVRPGSSVEKRKQVLEAWYRERLREEIPPIIARWEKIMEVRVLEFGIKKMRTKWGACNREAGRIWINLELAKKPIQCLEYIIVHEMVHFFERSHNQRFVQLMDKFLHEWRLYREELNRLPVSHVDWGY